MAPFKSIQSIDGLCVFYQKETAYKAHQHVLVQSAFVSWRKQVDVNSQKYDRKVRVIGAGKDGDERKRIMMGLKTSVLFLEQ